MRIPDSLKRATVRVYVPVGNGAVRRAYVEAGAGMIVSCSHWQLPGIDCPWILDNGAFTYWIHGQAFKADAFEKRVEQVFAMQPCLRPEWIVTPDKVADPGSLGYSLSWRRRLPDSLRWYLAIQDGMTENAVEVALSGVRFDGLFIGGSTTWKNENASAWCVFARAHNMPCHIGRVNGARRLQWALNIGADSLDGTGWTADPSWVELLVRIRTPESVKGLLFDDVPQDLKGHRRLAERREADAG